MAYLVLPRLAPGQTSPVIMAGKDESIESIHLAWSAGNAPFKGERRANADPGAGPVLVLQDGYILSIIAVMAALGVGSVVLSIAAIARWRRVAPLLGCVLVAAALGLESRGVFMRLQFGRMQKSMQALYFVAGRLIHDRISRGLPLPSGPPTTELDGRASRDGWGTPIVYVARGPQEGFLVAAGADRRVADVSLRSPESLTEFRLGDFGHDLVVKVSDKKNAEFSLVAWPNGSELAHGCALPSAFGCLAYWPQ